MESISKIEWRGQACVKDCLICAADCSNTETPARAASFAPPAPPGTWGSAACPAFPAASNGQSGADCAAGRKTERRTQKGTRALSCAILGARRFDSVQMYL